MTERRTQTAVHLGVRGADVRPDEVANLLGLPASPWKHEKGDTFDAAGPHQRTDGFCAFSSHAAVAPSADFEEHALWMLDRLTPHVALLTEWQHKGWLLRLDVVVVMNTRRGGFIARSEILRRLADLAIPVRWVALYAPDHTGFQAPTEL